MDPDPNPAPKAKTLPDTNKMVRKRPFLQLKTDMKHDTNKSVQPSISYTAGGPKTNKLLV